MRRISISICDDEEVVHQAVSHVIQRHYGNRYSGLEILHYYNAASILCEAERQQVVLMDIGMPDMDGIEAAIRLHDACPQCIVIMLSGRGDRMKDAFRTRATRFVTKPIEAEDLFEALDDAIDSLHEYEDLVFRVSGRDIRINPRDLIMLESSRNYVILYLQERSVSLKSSMRELEEALDPLLFLRVHKSYIINMGHIRALDGRELLLTGGLRAVISTRHAHDAMARLRAFDAGGDLQQPC